MQTGKKKIKKELQNEKAIRQCAKEFGIIGDLTRLKICYLLCKHKELTVSEIAALVGVSISAVSHTLQKLKEINLVKSRRDFRNVYYQLNPSPLTKVIEERLNKI